MRFIKIIFLLVLPLSLSAQRAGILVGSSSSKSNSGGGASNIEDITITVNPQQNIGTDVSITADANGAEVTSWRWRVLRKYFHTGGRADTLLHETSSVQNPTLTLDTLGFYDIQLIARNSTDKYVVYEARSFVVLPERFTEGEADLVIDMSAGAQFHDFRGTGTHPDYKIYLKGQTTNGYLELVDLRGTEGHPVVIQKANDNTQVTIQYSGGSGKPLYFSRYGAGQGAQYIIVNGFNLDGTPGIKVTAGASSTTTVRVEGKLTDVGFYGIEVAANPLTIDGAAIAIVPTVASDCMKDNWETNNLHVYYCTITAGEEGVYFGESSQSDGYIGNNGFNPPSGIGAVISRNTVLAAGRDGLQVGCIGGEGEDNVITDWGQQGDAGGHEACLVSNDGSFMAWRRNYCRGGDMFASIKSGEYPWAPESGHTSPQPTILEGNIFSSGSYSEEGFDEPFAIYGQNNPNSGAGSWSVKVRNNIIDSDNKCFEFLLALGGFASHNFEFTNNLVIKTGTAGDSEALNFTGNGKATLQTGTKTENNLVYNTSGDLSGLNLTDRSTGDYLPTSTSSAVFGGSPTSTGIASFDYLGFPLPLPGSVYFFGAYSLYNNRTITP
jgi:hypothetical protein